MTFSRIGRPTRPTKVAARARRLGTRRGARPRCNRAGGCRERDRASENAMHAGNAATGQGLRFRWGIFVTSSRDTPHDMVALAVTTRAVGCRPLEATA